MTETKVVKTIETKWEKDNQTRYGISHDVYLKRIQVITFDAEERQYVRFDIYRNGINMNNGQFPLSENNRPTLEWLGTPELLI